MLSGVEVRVPFLDEDLVRIGQTLPHHLKTDGNQTKLVLRELLKKYLPQNIHNYPKHGFNIPMDKAVDEKFHDYFEDYVLSQKSKTSIFLNTNQIKKYFSVFKRSGDFHLGQGSISRAGIYQRIFNILSIELWMRKFNLNW